MRKRRIEISAVGRWQFSLTWEGRDFVNVFMCLWVLIINVRMGLNVSIRLIMGPLCGTLS